MGKKLNTEVFINRSVEKHKGRYDYSEVVYISAKEKVKIICKVHGEFLQTPDRHLQGRGCPHCRWIKKTTEEFIRDAISVHGDTYLYDKVSYIKNTKKVEIICKKHGSFFQTPLVHLCKKGCPHCGISRRTEKLKRRDDNLYKLKCALRVRTKKYLYKMVSSNSRSTEQILGASWKEAMEHLNNNSYGFKVGQQGIDVDHIIPLSSAKCEEELLSLCRLENLQLLPSQYNQHVKRCKPFDKEDFENWLNKNIILEKT